MRGANRTTEVVKCIFAAVIFFSIQTGCLKKTYPVVEIRPDLLQLAITEINYHPIDDQGNNADQFEFIEIKNTGSTDVDLTDVQFNDGIDYQFPANTIIKPDEFIILASDAVEFKNRYGFDPFGGFAGKLSNGGEKISMEDMRANKKFLSVSYGTRNPWPKSADGDGNSLVKDPADTITDENSALYWRASFRKKGSPGADDPGVVYINEVLAHTDAPDTDAIELYNPNNSEVDISGWYLTDRKVDPVKFQIPAGNVIQAKGYMVFTFDSTRTKGFSLSEHGDDAYLFSDSSGDRKDGYAHGFTFGENENGVSFGRVVNSRGEEDFVPMSAPTLGASNAEPRVGPLVISEIMYHPKNNVDDYIEIANISGQEVLLYDPEHPKNTWKVDGIDFSFPESLSIKSNERVVVMSNKTTVSNFRKDYNIDPSVQVYQAPKALSNAGDYLVLKKPGEPYIDNSDATLPVKNPDIFVERIDFTDAKSWHNQADGTGLSLQRLDSTKYANDPINWHAAAANPGK